MALACSYKSSLLNSSVFHYYFFYLLICSISQLQILWTTLCMDHKAPVVCIHIFSDIHRSQSQAISIGNHDFDDLSKMQERMMQKMLLLHHHKRFISHWPTISMPTQVHRQCMTTPCVVRQSRRIIKVMITYRQGSWTKVKPLLMKSLQLLPHRNEDMQGTFLSIGYYV